MRYFAHDGSTTHGPASVDELTARPWFDGDVLVCPVGSDDSADWKPALAYPEFKTALLAPKRVAVKLEPLPAPLAARMAPAAEPAPQPAVSFEPCPHCGAGNPASARFCNACGWRMDGAKPLMEAPSAPAPAPAPAPLFAAPPAAFVPPPAFAPPAETAPAPAPAPVMPPPPAFGSPASAFAPPPAAAPAPLFGEIPREPGLPPYEAARPEPLPEPLPEAPPAVEEALERPVERPMERPPERSGPMSRGLSPFGEPERAAEPAAEPEHDFASLSSQMPHPIEPAPFVDEPAAPPEPAAAAAPAWKRPPVIAAFAGAAALAAFAAWSALKPAPAPSPAAPSGADLALSAPAASSPAPSPLAGGPMGDAAPAGMSPAVLAPSASPKPARPASLKPQSSLPSKPSSPAPRPKRKRAPRPAPVPAPDSPDAADAILIESRAAADEPTVPGAQSGSEPLGDPGAAPADVLPGIPRRPSVRPSRSKPAPKPAPQPQADADASLLDEALGGPPAAAPAAGPAGSQPAGPVSEADKLALQQAVEEFEFCAQLLAQGAFADHFDTCLCKETRKLPPYRDRRGFYASALEKEAKAGRLEVRAEIVSTRMENGAARIVAKWKAKGNDPGREVDETWIMDDGLWCKAP